MHASPNRIVRLSTACALTLLLGAAAAAPALATGAEDDAVGAARELPALVNASTSTVKGQRLASGACRYTTELRLAPDELAVRQDTIGVDDATCTMKVRRGTPADATTRAGRPVAARAAAAWRLSAGYYKTYVEDPVGIDVNAVRNDISWTWDGSRVAQLGCDKSYGWFTPSGWTKVADNFFCVYENGMTRGRSSSFAHFRNAPFCWPNTTTTIYDRNNVYGDAFGTLIGVSTVTNAGGCTNLLSMYKELRRTV